MDVQEDEGAQKQQGTRSSPELEAWEGRRLLLESGELLAEITRSRERCHDLAIKMQREFAQLECMLRFRVKAPEVAAPCTASHGS